MEAAKNLLSKTFNNSRSSYVDQDDNTAQIRPKVSLEQRIHPNPDAEVQRLGVLDKGAESDGKSDGKSSQIHAEQMEKLGLNSALWWNVNPSGSASRPNISDWTLSLGLGTSPTAGPSKPMASSAKASVTDRFGADYEQLADMALRRNQTQAKGKKPAPIQTSSSSDRVFRTAESSVGHTTSESSNGRKRKMVPWSMGSKRQKLPDTQAVPHERDLSEFGVRSPTSPRSYPDSSELNHNYPHGTESGSSYYAATAPSSRSRSQATPSTASAFAAGGFGRRSVPAHSTGDLRSEGRNVNALPRSKSTGQVFDPSTWEYQVVENLLNTKSSSPSAPSVPSAHASHHTSSGRPSTTTHSNSNPASPTSPRYSRPSQRSD
ncbi:hypothetical protein BT69DRAFT_683166 [Atractiella rhizophila]|nr:hypothetical protein BT69DRAFT_683166 [Atractiella rhizophila]